MGRTVLFLWLEAVPACLRDGQLRAHDASSALSSSQPSLDNAVLWAMGEEGVIHSGSSMCTHRHMGVHVELEVASRQPLP